MYKHNDLKGERFGRLTVIRDVGRSKDRHVLWLCKCDCGNEVTLPSNALVGKHTQSCGCLQKERTSNTRLLHGGSGDHTQIERLYRVWVSMRKRCNNPNDKSYQYYGAKGVTVCEEWNDYGKFREWALSNGYDTNALQSECTIDRINPYGNYEPNNCRWVSMAEQNRNKRAKMDEVEE